MELSKSEKRGTLIARCAMGWLGTPHVNGAKIKYKGVDCGMLLIASLEDAGLVGSDSIRVKSYSNEWHLHHSDEWFLHYVEKYCDKVEEMQVGDFLLYQYGRCISHGGVYVGNHTICHSVVDQGVILSDLNDVMFYDAKGRLRLRGIYRFRGE